MIGPRKTTLKDKAPSTVHSILYIYIYVSVYIYRVCGIWGIVHRWTIVGPRVAKRAGHYSRSDSGNAGEGTPIFWNHRTIHTVADCSLMRPSLTF